MTVIEAALKYLELGYSVIPIKGDAYAEGSSQEEKYKEGKKPLVSWLPFQQRRATADEVRDWGKRWPKMSLAIVTGAISGIATIDCDSDEAVQLFKDSVHSTYFTPTQVTPRGGKQYICKYQEKAGTKAGFSPKMDIRGDGGYFLVDPSHNGKSYQWEKGYEPWNLPPAPLPDKIFALYLKSLAFVFNGLSDPENKSTSQIVTQVTNGHFFQEGVRDEQLFHLANILVKGGSEIPFTKEVLIRVINSWGEHDERWVEAKIKSAMDRASRRDRNIMGELREYIESQEGHIKVTEWSQMSQIVTKQEKHALTMAFKRLFEEGKLKRGTRAGEYEIVNDTLNAIDFLSAEDKETPLLFPFNLQQYVKIYPKNIIVVAGEPNAGKTAFLLNIARENQEKHEIHYFSSEMGPMETRVRLLKFDMTPLSSWKVKFWERAEGFADVIRPDAVNIIDFLEITEDFWKVGRLMRDIFLKLDKGIAIIALQKNPTKKLKDGSETGTVGLGGYRGLEKPRLYLTMGNHILKIVKAKNWRTEANPNGKSIRFKIGGGCHFTSVGGWENENDPYRGLTRQPGEDPD